MDFFAQVCKIIFSVKTIVVLVDLSGIALMSYGAYLIFEPAGYIVGGGLLWLEANIDVFKGTRAERD